MRLLLTNDDGISARGLIKLASALSIEHEVTIVAPDMERSAASNSITVVRPLRLYPVDIPLLSGVTAYATDGTPADCVKLAVDTLGFTPDIVVSGINLGSNTGLDTHYSGTVSAAMEGAFLNLPSLAVSCCKKAAEHLDTAVHFALTALDLVVKDGLGHGSLLSVNVPDLPLEKIKGTKVTPLSTDNYCSFHYTKFSDPRGRMWFFANGPSRPPICPDDDTDDRWVLQGYVAMTPLQTDLTDFSKIERLKGLIEK